MESKEEFISIKDILEEELDNYFCQDIKLIEEDLRNNDYQYTVYLNLLKVYLY